MIIIMSIHERIFLRSGFFMSLLSRGDHKIDDDYQGHYQLYKVEDVPHLGVGRALVLPEMVVQRGPELCHEVLCLKHSKDSKLYQPQQSVQKYVDEVAKANGAKITIKKFVRFETGEGIEKKVEDFAAEVAAQRK